MPKEIWNKPVWSTAIVATLLIGAITSTITATLFISEKLNKFDNRLTAIETYVAIRSSESPQQFASHKE